MVADTEELENLDASETHARRLNAKEVLKPKNGTISFSRWKLDQSSCLEEVTCSSKTETVCNFSENICLME